MKYYCFILLLASYYCNAQTPAIGLHIGYGNADNTSFFNDEAYYDHFGVQAYTIGLQYWQSINQKLTFQTEFNLDRRGSSRRTFINHFTYLSLPVMLRRQYRLNSGVQPYWLAGIYTGLLIRDNVDHFPPGVGSCDIAFIELLPPRSFDMGQITGAGVEFPIRSGWVLATELRLQCGWRALYGSYLERTNLSILGDISIRKLLK